MQLSASVQYALVCLEQLRVDGEPISCHTLCKDRGLPERFVLQVMATLNKAGIVKSTRGVLGGYRLAKAAPLISLLDVVTALDGPLASRGCEHLGSLGKRGQAAVNRALGVAADHTANALSQVRISDL